MMMGLLLNADSIVVINNYIGNVEGIYSCNKEVCIAFIFAVAFIVCMFMIIVYKCQKNKQELDYLEKMHK